MCKWVKLCLSSIYIIWIQNTLININVYSIKYRLKDGFISLQWKFNQSKLDENKGPVPSNTLIATGSEGSIVGQKRPNMNFKREASIPRLGENQDPFTLNNLITSRSEEIKRWSRETC